MSVMRCDKCEHYVDTDYFPMEEIKGQVLCDVCAEDVHEEDLNNSQYGVGA